MKQSRASLCFRCEWRASFLERESRPRYECGEIQLSKYACYMYKPVRPVVLSPLNTDDKRPRFGPSFIAQREKFERIAEGKLKARKIKGEDVVLYWTNLK